MRWLDGRSMGASGVARASVIGARRRVRLLQLGHHLEQSADAAADGLTLLLEEVELLAQAARPGALFLEPPLLHLQAIAALAQLARLGARRVPLAAQPRQDLDGALDPLLEQIELLQVDHHLLGFHPVLLAVRRLRTPSPWGRA